MEKAKELLETNESDSARATELTFPPVPRGGVFASFYERFVLYGIRVDRVEPGFISCSLTVPPHLIDRNGYLQNGAVASLVDEAGFAVVHEEGSPMMVSVDMSISFVSTAKLHDELEITSRVLGQKGKYSGTIVLIRNKTTGEVVAEGRHSLFGQRASKI